MAKREVGKAAIALIKEFEGCKLVAYQDVVGVWTIGYGWTGLVGGKKICKGMKITQAQADSLLKKGLTSYIANVNKYQVKYNWNQNQFDALVCFAYNIGSIDGLTAKGTRSNAEIAAKFEAYNKAGGKVYNGLTRRRKAEKALFLKK